MPLTKSPPKAPKEEKPGKVPRFLNFLGIKKKQPAETSPELLRFELDNILDDIGAFADALPNDHPRKVDVKNSIGSLDNQAKKDIKKAIEMAHGVLDWAAEELRNAKNAPPSAQVQSPPKMQPQVQPPPKVQTSAQQPLQPPPAIYTPPLQPPAPTAKATLTEKQLKELKSEKPLGSGQFATTYKMTGPDGQNFAVKVPQAKDAPQNQTEREMAAEELKAKEAEFKREAEFYAKVGDHPNIAKCYGYQTVGEDENQQSGLVLELIEGKNAKDMMGDLRGKYLSGEMSQEEYFGVMQYTLMQMLKAADHMAKQGVSHRDMKPDNLMIDATTGDVKVVDFGVSQNIGQDRASSIPLGFAAPEIGKTLPSDKEDAFGIGATGYALSEQESFDYKRESGETLGKARPKYDSTKGPAIQVESDADAYKKLLTQLRSRMYKWEQTQAPSMPPNEAQELRDLLKQAETFGGPEQKFAEGVQTLRALQDRLPMPQEAEAAEARFSEQLENVQRLVDFNEDSLARATGLTEPQRLKALLESIRPLMAKAREHGDRMQYDQGITILQEVRIRLDDAEAPSGKHKAETVFTDFINKLMDPDPKKRMSPEEAMKHEFMQHAFLDDESARRVLQMQTPQPEKASDPGADAPRDKRYAALDRAVIEAERQVRELKSALPTEAAERMSLLVEMQALARTSSASKQALDEAIKGFRVAEKGGNQNQLANARQKFQETDLQSHRQLDDAWKKVQAINQQLEQRFTAARKDQQERAALQAELNQAARQVKALLTRSGGNADDFNNLIKQAQVLSKPGGALDQARQTLATIKSLITTTFDANTRQALLNDGITQARTAIETFLENAGDQLKDGAELLEEAETLNNDARVAEQSAFLARKEGDKDQSEKMTDKARSKRDTAAERTRDGRAILNAGNNKKKAAEEATTLLAEAEQLAQSAETLEQGYSLLDRANGMLRLSLGEAGATNATEGDYDTTGVNQSGEADAPERPEPTTEVQDTATNPLRDESETEEDRYQNTNA